MSQQQPDDNELEEMLIIASTFSAKLKERSQKLPGDSIAKQIVMAVGCIVDAAIDSIVELAPAPGEDDGDSSDS